MSFTAAADPPLNSLTLTPTAAALLALFAAFWLCVAVWATVRGLRLARIGSAHREANLGCQALLAAGARNAADRPCRPAASAVPSGSGMRSGFVSRRARWQDLSDGDVGLRPEEASALAENIRETRSRRRQFLLPGSRPRLVARPARSRRAGAAAVIPPIAVLLWFIDATDSEEQMSELRERGRSARRARLARFPR